MSERKTRGRQRIPIRLIENKDDLLVSFSKRRVGVYKKVSELSTLCGVDAGAIIFSPSGIPHSFFAPDFDSVVHGRRNADGSGSGSTSPRTRIRRLNKRLDEAIEQQEREEKREKQLAPAGMGWWDVPLLSLDAEQVKEQIEWFQALRAQIKTRLQELNIGAGDASGECFFAPAASLNQNDFPPHFDGYLFDPRVGGGYPAAPASLSGGGIGIGHVCEQQYLYPPSPLRGRNSHCYLPPQTQGYAEAGPSRPHQN